MSADWSILVIGYALGFYMAWNIGANDVANAMASPVGAKAITMRQALVIAGLLNFLGAAFIGSHVAETIRKGIVSPELMSDPRLALIGALSALLAAALWVSFATYKSLPVSTTHSIVGAMVGYGIVAGGFWAVNWAKMGSVVASWIVSPLFAIVISYLMFKLIVRLVLSQPGSGVRALTLSPLFVGFSVFVMILSFLWKTPLGKTLTISPFLAVSLSLLMAYMVGTICRRIFQHMKLHKEEDGAEGVFRYIQVGTACYVALAQGANDVANAIGPLAVIYFFVKTGAFQDKVPIPIFLLIFGGIGIAAGIAMAGSRVMLTMGEKITQLTNTRGFSVDF
ncbi:MAG: inorganic phosphate transporter, partial [Thermodesulfobacteriota bacterium]